MSLNEPTTKEIFDQIINNIEATLGQAIPLLPKAAFRVLSSAIAGVFTILYKFASWQFLQIFPSTADEESLERWGELVGIIRTPAVQAQIEIECTGTDGAEVLTGTRIVDNISGVVYLIDSDVTIAGGVGTTTMIATQGGSIGNVTNGTLLSFVTPLGGINNKCTVTDTIVTGIDKEDVDVYRSRVVDRFRKVPQGGAFADYEAWAVEVADIINAYPYSGDVEGTVEVFSESGTEVDGIPNASQLQAVLDSINLPDRRPVTAEVFSLAIIRTSFEVTVFGLDPDNTEARDLIEARLTQLFLSKEPFVDGLSIINNSVISQSEITGVISAALQTTESDIDSAVFEVTGTGDTLIRYNLGQGEKSKLGSVVYS